jgi:hypothetical protein
MGKGNFYKEIPWEGVNFTWKFAEIPGEYRHEKGVPQRGGGVRIIIGIAHCALNDNIFCIYRVSQKKVLRFDS